MPPKQTNRSQSHSLATGLNSFDHHWRALFVTCIAVALCIPLCIPLYTGRDKDPQTITATERIRDAVNQNVSVVRSVLETNNMSCWFDHEIVDCRELACYEAMSAYITLEVNEAMGAWGKLYKDIIDYLIREQGSNCTLAANEFKFSSRGIKLLIENGLTYFVTPSLLVVFIRSYYYDSAPVRSMIEGAHVDLFYPDKIPYTQMLRWYDGGRLRIRTSEEEPHLTIAQHAAEIGDLEMITYLKKQGLDFLGDGDACATLLMNVLEHQIPDVLVKAAGCDGMTINSSLIARALQYNENTLAKLLTDFHVKYPPMFRDMILYKPLPQLGVRTAALLYSKYVGAQIAVVKTLDWDGVWRIVRIPPIPDNFYLDKWFALRREVNTKEMTPSPSPFYSLPISDTVRAWADMELKILGLVDGDFERDMLDHVKSVFQQAFCDLCTNEHNHPCCANWHPICYMAVEGYA